MHPGPVVNPQIGGTTLWLTIIPSRPGTTTIITTMADLAFPMLSCKLQLASIVHSCDKFFFCSWMLLFSVPQQLGWLDQQKKSKLLKIFVNRLLSSVLSGSLKLLSSSISQISLLYPNTSCSSKEMGKLRRLLQPKG